MKQETIQRILQFSADRDWDQSIRLPGLPLFLDNKMKLRVEMPDARQVLAVNGWLSRRVYEIYIQ